MITTPTLHKVPLPYQGKCLVGFNFCAHHIGVLYYYPITNECFIAVNRKICGVGYSITDIITENNITGDGMINWTPVLTNGLFTYNNCYVITTIRFKQYTDVDNVLDLPLEDPLLYNTKYWYGISSSYLDITNNFRISSTYNYEDGYQADPNVSVFRYRYKARNYNDLTNKINIGCDVNNKLLYFNTPSLTLTTYYTNKQTFLTKDSYKYGIYNVTGAGIDIDAFAGTTFSSVIIVFNKKLFLQDYPQYKNKL